MKREIQNIAIVGLDHDQAYGVAKQLATVLEMQFLDCIELFEFDNIPRDLTKMLKEYGERYYRKKEKGTVKYVSGFSNTLINFESGMAMCKENILALKKNCLLIYLHMPYSRIKQRLEKKKYKSNIQRKFFISSENSLKKRIDVLKKESDITLDVSSGSELRLTSEILRLIKNFYGLN